MAMALALDDQLSLQPASRPQHSLAPPLSQPQSHAQPHPQPHPRYDPLTDTYADEAPMDYDDYSRRQYQQQQQLQPQPQPQPQPQQRNSETHQHAAAMMAPLAHNNYTAESTATAAGSSSGNAAPNGSHSIDGSSNGIGNGAAAAAAADGALQTDDMDMGLDVDLSADDVDVDVDVEGDEEDEDSQLDDDMMDRISSSPSIDDGQPASLHARRTGHIADSTVVTRHLLPAEDIDFEFVYALHTFIATVDGQANAAKGDTMVLLDDSNSYWWLVRVVKDGTIGYLPAEHIETPTERLARLNKHRNIDLSSTMLSDNAEKAKHATLRQTLRRRKNVMFAAPTYIEPSDAEWSTDDEDGIEDQFFDYDDADDTTVVEDDSRLQEHEHESQRGGDGVEAGVGIDIHADESTVHGDADEEDPYADPRPSRAAPGSHANGDVDVDADAPATDAADDHAMLVQPLRLRLSIDSKGDGLAGSSPQSDPQAQSPQQRQQQRPQQASQSPVLDPLLDGAGTFETKKISLTPNILRDDDGQQQASHYDVRERSGSADGGGSSRDAWDMLAPPDRSATEKKKKERKSVLSGLFKRKDKEKEKDKDRRGRPADDDELSEDGGGSARGGSALGLHKPGSASIYSLDSIAVGSSMVVRRE
ncbi:hypothetical protein KEM52_002300 [Ascosphaera acerosa]|nr:hypothetical protein KEM52_002300 [Ascosphaera acerosa]